jgi:hypothetical protein
MTDIYEYIFIVMEYFFHLWLLWVFFMLIIVKAWSASVVSLADSVYVFTLLSFALRWQLSLLAPLAPAFESYYSHNFWLLLFDTANDVDKHVAF